MMLSILISEICINKWNSMKYILAGRVYFGLGYQKCNNKIKQMNLQI